MASGNAKAGPLYFCLCILYVIKWYYMTLSIEGPVHVGRVFIGFLSKMHIFHLICIQRQALHIQITVFHLKRKKPV